MFCGRCGRAVNAAPLSRARLADPRPGDTTVLAPSHRPTGQGVDHQPVPTEPTYEADVATAPSPILSAPATQTPVETEVEPPPVPYMLSFSTGERIIVVGAGLLGRRPFTQPGETFDQLVSIADHERSVSKTHLEFGLESGDLWICDRYSANGTVIIPPAGAPRRLEPGRRYRVPRGGRVEIGDHWFDVR